MNDLSPGLVISPSLRLVRPLGEGGMAEVWIAEHATLRTNVVVKFLAAELATNADAIQRFSREASAASSVRSPHVVQIFDHGVAPQGVPYIAMELLEGEDLSRRLARERHLQPSVVAQIVTQVCRALSKAHEKSVIHRDIKPANIFLTDAGGGELFVKVLDFGLAKAPMNDLAGATRTGTLLGTPQYMSPEQVMGTRAIDPRADVWAVGVVAFEALTGVSPFARDGFAQVALAICHMPMKVPSELNPQLPKTIDAWFARACAREPSQRFASAKECSDAFLAAIGAPPAMTDFDQTQVAAPIVGHQLVPTSSAVLARPASVAKKSSGGGVVFAIVGMAFAMMLGIGGTIFFLTSRAHESAEKPAEKPAVAAPKKQEEPEPKKAPPSEEKVAPTPAPVETAAVPASAAPSAAVVPAASATTTATAGATTTGTAKPVVKAAPKPPAKTTKVSTPW